MTESIFMPLSTSVVKYGNVWIRRHWWKKGESIPGHRHAFNHVGLLYRGRVAVTVEGITKEFAAPTEVIIDKDREHRIEALEDDTVWLCVFAVRDEHGEVDIYGASSDPRSLN